MLQLELPLLGASEIAKNEAGRKKSICYFPLSILAHFALQNLSFHLSPGLPHKLRSFQGELQGHLCSGESQIGHWQQDMTWL